MKFILFFTTAILPCLSWSQPRYTLVISEIMADPSPSAGLPQYEWIELYNTGNEPVNLRNWRIGDGTSISGAFPEFILQAHQYLIVCASAARSVMENYGRTLVVTSFPSLDNAGKTIALYRADGYTMHALRYSSEWYGNVLKKEGGWSLEMIDPANPCSGSSNWKASVNITGGTPGAANSVAASLPDHSPPMPLRSYAADQTHVVIIFNEPLDSISAVRMTSYSCDHTDFVKATCIAPLFDKVELETRGSIDSDLVYTILMSGLEDCAQNQMSVPATVKTGLASSRNINCIVNEILFNPKPGGYDYVEIYNPGPSIADASHLYLANKNTSGQISNMIRITSATFNILPGEYIVATEDPLNLGQFYLVKDPQTLFAVSTPSYADDKGTVVLLDLRGTILDEVNYIAEWHHKLIANAEGVSLERLDPARPPSKAENWHSAASTAGYGTPGYANSQSVSVSSPDALVGIRQKIFSPDNDGIDDVLTISFNTEMAGFIANVHIFDVSGRLVKHLVRNELLGKNGYWNWNGLNEKQQLLPVGMYIIQTALFHPGGQKKRYRHVVALARKFN